MSVSLPNVIKFYELNRKDQDTIENHAYPHKPSCVALFAKVGISTLSTAGIALYALSTKRWSWGLAPRLAVVTGVTISFVASLAYQFDRFEKEEDIAQIKSFHSLVKGQLQSNEYTALEIGGKTYYITQAGFSEDPGTIKGYTYNSLEGQGSLKMSAVKPTMTDMEALLAAWAKTKEGGSQ